MDIMSLQMQIDESVQIFLSRVISIVNQIRTYGDNMSEQTMVAKVLRSVAPKFDHMVVAIGESYLSTCSFLELMESLQTHEANSITEEKGNHKAFYRKGESSPGRGGHFHRRFGGFLFQHGIKMSSASTAKDMEMCKLIVSEKRGKNNKHAMQKKTKSDPCFSWCIQKVKRKDPQSLKKQQKMKNGIKHCKKYYW